MTDTTGEKKVPNIRFKGFTDAWEQRKLKKIAIINPKDSLPAKFNYVDLESVVGTNLEKYQLLTKTNAPSRAQRVAEYNDIFYQTVRPYQRNNFLFQVENSEYPFVFSTGYAQIRTNINASFLFTKLQTNNFVNTVLARCTGTSYPAINSNDLGKILIYYPSCMMEQDNIGKLFQTIDNLLTLYQRKLGLLEQLKKGMLQKLFANSNTKHPELRFKGYEGEWEEQRLGDLGNIKSGVGFPENEQGGKTGIPFYKVSDMNISGNQSRMQVSNNYVSNEQIQRRHWKPITTVPALIFAKVGAALMLDRKRLVEHPFLIDNNTMSYSLTDSWDKYFAITLFHNVYLPQYAQVGALPSLNASDIKVIKVKLPNLNEQRRIGEVFKMMDSIISLHHGKISMLTYLKKFLLQQMFI